MHDTNSRRALRARPLPRSYDTVDSVHVLVAGQKDFLLVGPAGFPNLYLDFPANQRPLDTELACPAAHSFGCDAFSCYAYAPFNSERVDLEAFPRVADAIVYTATSLFPGDALLLPAFWAHSVIHYPREGGGRNVALSFVKPGAANMTTRPFSPDVLAMWQAAQRGEGGERVPARHRLEGRGRKAGTPVRIEVGVDGRAYTPTSQIERRGRDV